MKKLNESGASGVIATIMVFVIIITAAVSFIMINAAFTDQYANASADLTNNSGIFTENTTPYQSVKTISTGITDSMPVAIFLGFLLAVIVIVMLVWAILKREG